MKEVKVVEKSLSKEEYEKMLAVKHFLNVHSDSQYLKSVNTSASSGMGIKK